MGEGTKMPTRCRTRVYVYNQTGHTIDVLKLTYGYKRFADKTFEERKIDNGSKTNGFEVEYDTTWLIPCWWKIEWTSNETNYVTQPSNFKQLLEWGANLSEAIPIAGRLVGSVRKGLPSRVGFKAFKLKYEDREAPVNILLSQFEYVYFEAKSGKADTKYVKIHSV
jgi:hypothetical protein